MSRNAMSACIDAANAREEQRETARREWLESAHVLGRETAGSGNMECITATCSCGWRGIGHYAHSDTQLGDVARDGRRHLQGGAA